VTPELADPLGSVQIGESGRLMEPKAFRGTTLKATTWWRNARVGKRRVLDGSRSLGTGYATAALRAFLDVDLHRPLHAHVADHNVGSRRVLEKCGFVLDHSAQEEDVMEHVLVLTD
jgi:Acetyltransferase (GNAT) domain